jgi:hypothetical protein
MSTRANIILKEGEEKLYFYRHSDGYPSGTMPTLEKFLNWMKEGKIRNNIQQAGGWLIVLGAIEYNAIPKYKTIETTRYGRTLEETDDESIQAPTDWKVGAYEPTTDLHGDIEYLYTIDMEKMEIQVQAADMDYKTGKWTFTSISENRIVNRY